MRQITKTSHLKRIEIESQIAILEDEIIPDLQKSLDDLLNDDGQLIIDPEYKEQDIECRESELLEAQKGLLTLRLKLTGSVK